MNNYDEEQSEDGELAQSPVAKDEMDFSLSEDDMDPADSLHIKPPQASIRPSHRERRGHKSSIKDRRKEHSRREKKHLFRDRDKHDKIKRDVDMKNSDRDINNSKTLTLTKEYSRDKLYHREKEHREKEVYRDKEHYREKDLYRDNDIYRPDKDTYREKESYRMKESYVREKDKELYVREKEKELYVREKDNTKDKDSQREFWNREGRQRYELERRVEIRRNYVEERREIRHNEKENKDKASSGDKELEDLRSRLLSKRKSKEQSHSEKSNDRLHTADSQSQSEKDLNNSARLESRRRKSFDMDKSQQDKRNRFIEAEREMARRKESSRTELEARRERRRGEKRSVTPDETTVVKRIRSTDASSGLPSSPLALPAPPTDDDIVLTVSDQSDLEVRSEDYNMQNSEQEEGEHSGTESESDSSYSESDSDTDSNSSQPPAAEAKGSNGSRASPTSPHSPRSPRSPTSPHSRTSRSPPSDKSQRSLDSRHSSDTRRRSRSVTRSRSRSNSRSNSFSPPPAEQAAREQDAHNQAKHTNPDLDDSLPPYYPALQGCRSVEEFQCLNRIEEGTYGVVYRARDKSTEEIVALKRLKMEREREGFPITSLREINTLLKGQHPNVVTVREIVVGSNMDKIFIVMDYVEHDLRSLMDTMREKKQVFLPGEVKCLMQQLLRAVFHLHDNWILHRDLKTSNLLLSHKGILKVGDFGLAREYGSPLRHYTSTVVTLWYRAPELLLLCKQYSTSIDMWSVGCIFAEFVTMNPLFPGKAEMDQINRIFKELGTPSEAIWSGYSQLPAVQKVTFAETPGGGLRVRAGPDLLSELGYVLLQGFLTYDPARRITADAALEHAYFKEHPVAIDPAMFPTWPAKSEGGRRAPGVPRTPPPPARHRDQDEQNEQRDQSLGFHMGAGANLGRDHNSGSGGGFSLKF